MIRIASAFRLAFLRAVATTSNPTDVYHMVTRALHGKAGWTTRHQMWWVSHEKRSKGAKRGAR